MQSAIAGSSVDELASTEGTAEANLDLSVSEERVRAPDLLIEKITVAEIETINETAANNRRLFEVRLVPIDTPVARNRAAMKTLVLHDCLAQRCAA